MMLPFMPWCRIDREYQIGEARIVPYRGRDIDRVDDCVLRRLERVLSTYRTIGGRPVDHAAIVFYGGHPFGTDLGMEELESLYECVQLACFASLAGRVFFTPEAPGNSDVFRLYVQRFQEDGFVTIRTRRREGHTWSAWALDDIVMGVPPHVSPIRSVSIDQRLLDALVTSARRGDPGWGRWEHALSCFNQANTDSDAFSYQVEWGLVCSAFERLLDTASDYEAAARGFAETMVPSRPVLVRDAQRHLDRWRGPDAPIRLEWLKEFYRVRGDFSHGRLATSQPMAWHWREHLTLAAIAFPLLVRRLLQRAGLYGLTAADTVMIDAFESFADQPGFLAPPQDSRSSMDTWWTRALARARRYVGG